MNKVPKRKAENKTSFLFMTFGKKAIVKIKRITKTWRRKKSGKFFPLKRKK
jgi:hypothetical protein